MFLYIDEVCHLQTDVSQHNLVVGGVSKGETEIVVAEELMETRQWPVGTAVVVEYDVVTNAQLHDDDKLNSPLPGLLNSRSIPITL